MFTNKKTYYQLILDRSGSMGDCILPTVEGFNAQMEEIKSLQKKFPDQQFLVSLTTFNNEVVSDVYNEDPSRIKRLIVSESENPGWLKRDPDTIEYRPSGGTALYDAIGMSVERLESDIRAEIARNEATVVVIIITDGHENASHRYTYTAIKSLIQRLEATEDWIFVYLGATPDAVEVAEGLKINPKNSRIFDKDHMKSTFEDMAMDLKSYAMAKRNSLKPKEFLKEDTEDKI